MENKFEKEIENGVQPLDAIMTTHELTNTDIVKSSPHQLSFKMINKARKGRRVSTKIQVKITEALNFALDGEARFKRIQLFNYR